MISLKKLQQLENLYLKPIVEDDIYEYVKLTTNIKSLKEFIILIKDLYDDTINMYIDCEYFHNILKKFDIKLKIILFINNIDDLKKYLNLKKKKLLEILYNSNTAKQSKFDQKKKIELDRRLNIFDKLFINLYNEIIYIYKWIILINICISKYNVTKKKIYQQIFKTNILDEIL